MRAILFDKDGTLLDFEATWGPLYRSLALDLAGGDAERATAMLVAGGLDEETGRMGSGSVLGAGTTADIVRLWYPGSRRRSFRGGDRADRRAPSMPTASIARSSFPAPRKCWPNSLRWTIAMGIATNDATEAAAAAIAALGLDDYLPHVFGYDSVPHPKPAPDIVLAFAAATGIDPSDIAVVGDNRFDMEMARAAGAGARSACSPATAAPRSCAARRRRPAEHPGPAAWLVGTGARADSPARALQRVGRNRTRPDPG